MSRAGAIAAKTVGAVAAGMLSVGAVTAFAASPSVSPAQAASVTDTAKSDRHSGRRPIARAVIESEADVLGIKASALINDLRQGETVAELARDEGLNKARFTTRLLIRLTLRLETLVENKVISLAHAKGLLHWISTGHVPFWEGAHFRM
jgi:hypothetical protein